MKVKDIIKNIETKISEGLFTDKEFVDTYEFPEQQFDIYSRCLKDNTRFWRVSIAEWVCTDTWVGRYAYIMDEKIVAIGSQPYRKSNMILEWISKEDRNIVKNYFLSLVEDYENIDILDINEDIDSGYVISYVANLLKHHTNALYNGKNVKLLKNKKDGIKENDVKYKIEKQIWIEFENGDMNLVEMEDLIFPYLIDNKFLTGGGIMSIIH